MMVKRLNIEDLYSKYSYKIKQNKNKKIKIKIKINKIKQNKNKINKRSSLFFEIASYFPISEYLFAAILNRLNK